ncbi:Response regulator receiver domain-containing protein [Dehalogenimonas formicexedens]|uniref:Response regulator receiver domain-containing protein n=1 Tax=Dehalogenimonas formicexedens TaxID=1839801 RepID=A0A1P8F9X2_9CHLR|nr:response regulator transcription factor [Dehalogenimonas formicexedens]APV45243.1 Response regulator receiver domain-containing protein [Dehalogenimonas formicexedens]
MRVLIADDDLQVRRALRLLIEQHFDHVVIEEAAAAEQLLEISPGNSPDLILLDWELPVNNRSGLFRGIRNKCPEAAVVALSALPESRKEALACGCRAFISKNDPPEAFIPLLRAMATG